MFVFTPQGLILSIILSSAIPLFVFIFLIHVSVPT